MKQYLLLLPMMCLTATTSMAQTSYDTAIEAKIGENTYNVDSNEIRQLRDACVFEINGMEVFM